MEKRTREIVQNILQPLHITASIPSTTIPDFLNITWGHF